MSASVLHIRFGFGAVLVVRPNGKEHSCVAKSQASASGQSPLPRHWTHSFRAMISAGGEADAFSPGSRCSPVQLRTGAWDGFANTSEPNRWPRWRQHSPRVPGMARSYTSPRRTRAAHTARRPSHLRHGAGGAVVRSRAPGSNPAQWNSGAGSPFGHTQRPSSRRGPSSQTPPSGKRQIQS